MPTPSGPNRVPFPVPAPRWELALAQLRALPDSELEGLARRWLSALGGRAVGLDMASGPFLAFEAALGEPPLAVPVMARVYRRRQQLQRHHVEAFLGHMVRSGCSAGLLATTGPVTDAARRAADAHGGPRLRLLSGEEWLRELALHRIGVSFRAVPVWLIRPDEAACRRGGGRRLG